MDVDTLKAWRDARGDEMAEVMLKCAPAVADATVDMTRGIAFKTAGVLAIMVDDAEVQIPSGVLGVGLIHRIACTGITSNNTAVDVWFFW